jgi:hypothetical protein
LIQTMVVWSEGKRISTGAMAGMPPGLNRYKFAFAPGGYLFLAGLADPLQVPSGRSALESNWRTPSP